jgi:chromosome segregation ATPase
MGRQASVTIEHVRAAVAALRAEGNKVSSRAVREKLGNVGSMGTVNKLLQQCLSEQGDTPESLRQLPPELQHAVLVFADRQADVARRQVAEELISCRREMGDLAEDNEQLTATIEDLREQLVGARSDRATVEGRVAQALEELAGAREETAVERRASEAARVELAKLQLRVAALESLEDELRDVRAQYEAQRSECARAAQAAAVLEAQKLALGDQVQELKGELANARAAGDRLDKKIQGLSDLLDKERATRAVIEREFAVASALSSEQTATEKKGRKHRGVQTTFWEGESPDGQVSPTA